ncbi:MAG: hypothetical protein P4L87_23110 [Formivibrio sp.]|nr:hypothetical protein [Formivibrio sp.]
METTVLVALVGFLGSVFAAVFAYYSTKRRERDAEWRKEKLAYYKAFVESLSGIVEGDDSSEGHKAFARATNNLLLFAPQPVIEALNAFRHEIRVSNPSRSQERHDILLASLLFSIRHDVGVSPTDDIATFKPILWASGAGKNAT